MKTSRSMLPLVMLVLALVVASCAAPATPQPPAPTAVVAPTQAPTRATPEPVEPTPKRVPFNLNVAPQPVSGNLAAQNADRWVLALGAGQQLVAQVMPNQGQVALAVWGVDGTVLMSDHAGAPAFDGVVPAAQDYYVDVINVSGTDVAYALQLSAPPAATATPIGPVATPTPQRLTFAAGSSTILMQGKLNPQSGGPYVIALDAGRTLQISAASPNGQPIVTVVGADGTPLQTDHAGAATFNQALPKAQDYFITVLNQGQAALDYSLQVTVPPLPTKAAPTAVPPTKTPAPPAPTMVIPPPVIDYFTANPTTLDQGQCLNLGWQTSAGTNEVEIKRNDEAIYTNLQLGGNAQECPPGAGNWTYRLVARNSAGLKQTRDVNVTVNSPAPQHIGLSGNWSDNAGFSFDLQEAIGCSNYPCAYTGTFADFRAGGSPNTGQLDGSFDGSNFSFSVVFEVPGSPAFQFNGTSNTSGTKLSGNWSMGGESGGVTFRR